MEEDKTSFGQFSTWVYPWQIRRRQPYATLLIKHFVCHPKDFSPRRDVGNPPKFEHENDTISFPFGRNWNCCLAAPGGLYIFPGRIPSNLLAAPVFPSTKWKVVKINEGVKWVRDFLSPTRLLLDAGIKWQRQGKKGARSGKLFDFELKRRTDGGRMGKSQNETNDPNFSFLIKIFQNLPRATSLTFLHFTLSRVPGFSLP